MNIVIKVLGVEVLSLRTGEAPGPPEKPYAPDYVGSHVGFTSKGPYQGVPYA